MTSCSPASITGIMALVFKDLLSGRPVVNYWRRLVIRFFSGVVAELIFRHETTPFVFSADPRPRCGRPGYRNTSNAGGAAGEFCKCLVASSYGFHSGQDDDDGFARSLPPGAGGAR